MKKVENHSLIHSSILPVAPLPFVSLPLRLSVCLCVSRRNQGARISTWSLTNDVSVSWS